ncbi:MAG: 50S ribosomal protein L32 [Deltaproteobacteria bacterium]|nr:50S ribosomal protein L32 [Deltaproteobacteria bacterium]MBI3078503.1 50S ribosomal protein L32 [Deltaproteobacteria bacterium]
MPNPKRRRSNSLQGRMRAHKKLEPPAFHACPQCGEPRLSHRACPHCGTYRGREILRTEEAK